MRNLSLAGIILVAILGLSLLAGAFIAGAAFWKVHGRSIEEKYGPKKAEPAVSHDRLVRALRSDDDVQMEKDFREHPFMVDKDKASNLLISIHDTAGNPIPNHSLEVIIPGFRRVSYHTQTNSKGEAKVEVLQGAKTIVAPHMVLGYSMLPAAHEFVPSKKFEEVPFVALPEKVSENRVSKETIEMRERLKDPAVRAHLNAEIEKHQSPRPVWINKHGAPDEFCIVHADPNCPRLLEIQKRPEAKSWIVKKRQVKSDKDGKYFLLIDDDGSPLEEYGTPLHCECASK